MKPVLVIRSLQRMQSEALTWRRQGRRVALVPTMGYLHTGHMSLCDRARRTVGPQGIVVVSLFVNPTQFGPKEDLKAYPRDFASDQAACETAGVNLLFAPTSKAVYAQKELGNYSTYVVEESLSRGMEGASRPGHFRGVATVVAKLFNLVLPEVAVFGAKDFQQAAVIRRMTTNLNFPIKIIVAPTRREKDGLAMSSRNAYLDADQRTQATCLHRAIQAARKQVVFKHPKPIPAEPLRNHLHRMIESHPAAQVDYLAFFDPTTLQAVKQVRRGTQFALAVKVGTTRLIDNALL